MDVQEVTSGLSVNDDSDVISVTFNEFAKYLIYSVLMTIIVVFITIIIRVVQIGIYFYLNSFKCKHYSSSVNIMEISFGITGVIAHFIFQ